MVWLHFITFRRQSPPSFQHRFFKSDTKYYNVLKKGKMESNYTHSLRVVFGKTGAGWWLNKQTGGLNVEDAEIQ